MPDTRASTAQAFEEAVSTQIRAINKSIEAQDGRLEKFDQRFDNLEGSLGNQFASQEDKFDLKFAKLEELVPSVASQSGQDNSRTFNRNSSHSPTGSGFPRSNQNTTTLAKIDFPRFNGDKMKDWLFKVEQFFEIDHTPEEAKVKMAAMHMEDIAANWHQSLVSSEYGYLVLKDWSTYRDVLVERFEDLWDDPVEELKKLQETNGIVKYHNQFESIRNRIGGDISEDMLVRNYLAGLCLETQMQSLAFYLANQHEHC